jgi:copper resistance protein B
MNVGVVYPAVAWMLVSAVAAAAPAEQRTESERRHVPPDPPQHVMGAMSNREMIEMMQMDDAASFGMVKLDQLEWSRVAGEGSTALEADAWYGKDYNKIWLKAEGEIAGGDYDGRTELLWDHALTRWFNLQSGVRQDFGAGSARSWLAVGVQGLAPYWIEVEAAAYVGDAGRVALRLTAEYDWLLTQRLILQPEIDVDIYGEDDRENRIGAGVAETELSLRLRYEVQREFAPYIGVVWSRRHGDTAAFERAAGDDPDVLYFSLGLRAWF